MTDELLFKNLDLIDTFEAPYCIVNNTLLSLYRDGKLFPIKEKECVILIPAALRFKARNHQNFRYEMFALSGLGDVQLEYRICLIFYTEIGDLIVTNPYMDNFYVYPKSIIYPHIGLKLNDRIIPAPADIERYLTMFYGDWKTPVPEDKWDWAEHSPGIIKALSIDEAVTKYKQQYEQT